MEENFLAFVAEIMEVEENDISLDTEYNSIPQWDSLMHLRLIMEIESEYGCSIDMGQAEKIKKLRDFYEYTIGNCETNI